MKLKLNFLVVLIYLVGLFPSYGLFNAINYKAEVYDTHMVECCSLDDIKPAKVSATATTTKTYNTYLEAYFNNLTNNFGYNYKGSCGYVAMGMLLSYYDNFYSDNIIPENYDKVSEYAGTDTTKSRNMIYRNDSPGIYKDDDLFNKYPNRGNDIKNITAREYYNYLLDCEKYSLHAKLILFANEIQGLYDFDVANDKYPCGISMGDIIQVLHMYLYMERGFKWSSEFWFRRQDTGSEEEKKQFIIDQIDAGYPVCVSIGKYDAKGKKTYHAVVAYAHDNSGTIFYHSGWQGYNTKATLNSLGYTFIDDAFVLRFNFPEHIHSDNYKVTIGSETKYYCYCNDDIVTYKHDTHNYNYDYVLINGNSHCVYCPCGDYKSENHDYSNRYVKLNTLLHTAYCKCGAATTQSHSWLSYKIGKLVQCMHCKLIKESSGGEIGPIIKNSLMYPQKFPM